mgnify:CR=1 FL=1
MALKGKKKQTISNQPFEKTADIKKLSLFVTIVNAGQATPILRIFEDAGVSAQFVQRGKGTATKQILDILGVEDNGKDVVLSLIKQESIPDVKNELNAFFVASKKNKGIGFSIPMTSIIGVKVYQFLANAL